VFESPRTGVIVSPLSKAPEADTSAKANFAESLMAGVRVSIGPVKPKIIPTLISANATDETVVKPTIAARSNFFIFPPRKFYKAPII
jgi:hypothetical protein